MPTKTPSGTLGGAYNTRPAIYAIAFAAIVILLLAGCATVPTCNMGTMSAAQLERALVKGCGR